MARARGFERKGRASPAQPWRSTGWSGAAWRGLGWVTAALGLTLGPPLLMGGCGLEVPQRPSFDTVLNIPLAEEIYTGQQLADGALSGEPPMGGYALESDGSGPIARLSTPIRLVVEAARAEGDPFEIETDAAIRDRVVLDLREVLIIAEVENHFAVGVGLRLHFARSSDALFMRDELVVGSDAIAAASADTTTTFVGEAATTQIEMRVSDSVDLRVFTAGRLFGALEIMLIGDGEHPMEIWSTDYVKVRGMVSFRYRIE